MIAMSKTTKAPKERATSPPTFSETGAPPTPENHSSAGLMDPGRQRLAVSIGAVEIIVSALNALRDAGQLPEYLNTVFDKTGEQPGAMTITDIVHPRNPPVPTLVEDDFTNESTAISEKARDVPQFSEELPPSSFSSATLGRSESFVFSLTALLLVYLVLTIPVTLRSNSVRNGAKLAEFCQCPLSV